MVQQVPPGYAGSIPEIAKAFANDPRSKLSQSMLATGSSTAPVAGGGWAIPDGLARAAQAIAGALIQKKQEKKYAARETAYTDEMRKVAEGLGGQPAAPPAPPAPPPDQYASVAASMAPQIAAQTSTQRPRQQLDAQALYQRGIVPIEGGTDPKTGAFRTSPKGAIGPGQIMPRTAPEAAKLAGVPYDANRLRTDPAYNNLLGTAYYGKQLETFGDPLKAAAAYNGGPGATRRAIRRATKAGEPENWVNYFPAANTETPAYVKKFAAATGAGGVDAGMAPDAGGAFVAPPQMEDVPQGLAAPDARPTAPERPAQIQSRSLNVAKQLLASGNPDLMAIAQTYLEKGTAEDFDAQKLASQQEQEQDQLGYQYDLSDNNNQRSDFRQDQSATRRDVLNRNFQREEKFGDRQFQAGQAAEDRAFRNADREDQQGFTAAENEKNRVLDRWQTETTVAGRQQTAQEKADAKRSQFFLTPTGNRLWEKSTSVIENNDKALANLDRFIALNEEQSTGGITGYIPGLGSVNSKIGQMQTIANEFTLEKIGGSLGTAISDGDRKFIADSSLSTSKTKETNAANAQFWRKAITRKSDFEASRLNALAEGRENTFINEWNMYKTKVPVAGKGDYVPFSQWRQQAVQKYDAQGNKL